MNILDFIYRPVIAILTSAAIVSTAVAQDTADCRLPVMVKVNEGSCELSGPNVELLTNKLEQVVGSEGFGGSELSHLCLTASVSETDRQVISGSRPLITTRMDVYLVLSNVISGEKFGASSIAVSGAGRNDAQAFRKALAGINTANPDLSKFLTSARRKVFDYYEAHIPAIIQQSNVLANRGEYEKALFMLSTVPPCCKGYDSVGDAMLAVWQTYLDQDCAEKLAKATAVWRASQTDEAALMAASYLAAIDRKSACVEGADALLNEIAGKVGENIARVIAREDEDRAFEKEQVRAAIDMQREELAIKRDKVDAIRQLALAYAQFVLGPVVNNLSQPQPAPVINVNNNDPKK